MRLTTLAFLGVLFLAAVYAAEEEGLHNEPVTSSGEAVDALVQEVTPTNQGARVVRRAQGGGGGGGGGGGHHRGSK